MEYVDGPGVSIFVGWHPSQPSFTFEGDGDMEVTLWSVVEVLVASRGPTESFQAMEEFWVGFELIWLSSDHPLPQLLPYNLVRATERIQSNFKSVVGETRRNFIWFCIKSKENMKISLDSLHILANFWQCSSLKLFSIWSEKVMEFLEVG